MAKRTLTCFCCGTTYTQGQFRCCAPPNGMPSHKWLALTCPMAPHGCGKCAQHCQCPSKAERLGRGPLATLAQAWLEEAKARQLEQAG